MLTTKQKNQQQQNIDQSLQDETYMDTTDNAGNNTSLNTLSLPGQQQQVVFDPCSHTMPTPSLAATTSNETATSIHPTTEHYMSVMSPISHSSSQHSMEISSDNETSEESVKSRLFLQNVSSSYGFDDSVPDAKPFYMYTRKDLIPVVCVPSFLYIVFRNPNSFEATFFKV